MEKLARVKQEEFEREEAALIPLRQYLMANVIPTLTKALIEVVRIRPEDPLEFLVWRVARATQSVPLPYYA